MPFATAGGVSRADKSGDTAWIEITEDQYAQAIAGMLAGQVVTITGGFAVTDPPKPPDPPAPPPPTLDDAKAQAHQQVDAQFSLQAALLVGDYPAAERETWPNQQAEADAWHADNTVVTPYLDAIAAARGVDPVMFRQAVYDNVTQFKTASATLVGKRQRLSDEIDAATTVDEAQAIQW